jgi:hypothetical protein
VNNGVNISRFGLIDRFTRIYRKRTRDSTAGCKYIFLLANYLRRQHSIERLNRKERDDNQFTLHENALTTIFHFGPVTTDFTNFVRACGWAVEL